jgi:hypothetical protein
LKLKHLLAGGLVVLGITIYASRTVTEVQLSDVLLTEAPISAPMVPVQEVFIQADNRSFKCDGRQHCSEMTLLEEARFFLRNCPNTKMDGDNDGNPCERQF